MSSIKKRPSGRWRARYRDDDGKEHSKVHARKVDAQGWLDEQTASLVAGTHVTPRTARTTVDEWCDTWIEGYGTRSEGTVRQAKVHLKLIRKAFGSMQLSTVRASHVKAWTVALGSEGYSTGYVYALHSRLAQLFSDAVHDGIVARSPCSRRTSPPMAKQRPYVATTEQVWALHDAMPVHLRPAIQLGAFAGLRVGEVCGLRVSDVDFMRGVVQPTVQHPERPLKTETSRTAIPIPASMSAELSAHVARCQVSEWLLANEWGHQLHPRTLERAFRVARGKVDGLPAGFRFHDLRHYFASVLIASGLDVKVVQARLRHASAKTTLDTYAHLMPDRDDSSRAAVDAVFADRLADDSRTKRSLDG